MCIRDSFKVIPTTSPQDAKTATLIATIRDTYIQMCIRDSDSPRQDPRLTRARTGDHQQRSSALHDRRALGRGESF